MRYYISKKWILARENTIFSYFIRLLSKGCPNIAEIIKIYDIMTFYAGYYQ